MAAQLSDEDLRAKLTVHLGQNEVLPPIIDATRPLLIAKLSKLENVKEIEIEVSLKPQHKVIKTTQNTPAQIAYQNDVTVKKFKTFVFFDLEATGLPSNTRPPRITELCLKAIDVEHFLTMTPLYDLYKDSDGFEDIHPRIINSLNLCFNPAAMIPDIVTDITGLSNELLEHQPRFSSSTGQLLKAFLQSLPQPLCLVAHNGNKYDYPLLQAELLNRDSEIGSEIYVIDSLNAMRYIYDEKKDEPKPQENISVLLSSGILDDEPNENLNMNDVKKPCLRTEDELNMFKTPEHSPVPRDFFMSPPPTGHSSNRKKSSELMSSDRKKNGAKIKKKLEFDRPNSFSLPKLHEHIFGRKPKISHGAGVDVDALIRVCASKGEGFVSYAQNNFEKFQKVKKMW